MGSPKTLLVQLAVDDQQSARLQNVVKDNLDSRHIDYKHFKKVHPVHCTLAFYNDVPDFDALVDKLYSAHRDKNFDITAVGLVKDDFCITLLIDKSTIQLPIFPPEKHAHLTMALHKRKPVYSNTLLCRLTAKKERSEALSEDELFIDLTPPVRLTGTLEIKKFQVTSGNDIARAV